MVRGTFVIQHDGGQMTMKVGDFNWMPAQMIHQAWSGSEETIVFVLLDGPWEISTYLVFNGDVPGARDDAESEDSGVTRQPTSC